jgi:hypothetical protein
MAAAAAAKNGGRFKSPVVVVVIIKTRNVNKGGKLSVCLSVCLSVWLALPFAPRTMAISISSLPLLSLLQRKHGRLPPLSH